MSVTVDRIDRDAADEMLNALADPMRRRILDILATHGGGTATTLAAALSISRQAVVKYLAVLDRDSPPRRRAGRPTPNDQVNC